MFVETVYLFTCAKLKYIKMPRYIKSEQAVREAGTNMPASCKLTIDLLTLKH